MTAHFAFRWYRAKKYFGRTEPLGSVWCSFSRFRLCLPVLTAALQILFLTCTRREFHRDLPVTPKFIFKGRWAKSSFASWHENIDRPSISYRRKFCSEIPIPPGFVFQRSLASSTDATIGQKFHSVRIFLRASVNLSRSLLFSPVIFSYLQTSTKRSRFLRCALCCERRQRM